MKITICNMPMAEGIWKTIGSSLSDVAASSLTMLFPISEATRALPQTLGFR